MSRYPSQSEQERYRPVPPGAEGEEMSYFMIFRLIGFGTLLTKFFP